MFWLYNNFLCMGKLKIWATEVLNALFMRTKFWYRSATRPKARSGRRPQKNSVAMASSEAMFNADRGTPPPKMQIHQPPRPRSQQGRLERWRTRDTLQQVRGIRQQVVSITETSSWPVKHYPFRTQTKIKNYFYGRIRFFLKLIIKIILRDNTGFIGDIKT